MKYALYFVSAFIVLTPFTAQAVVDYSIHTVDTIRVTAEKNKQVTLKWKKVQKAKFYQVKVLREKANGNTKFVKRVRTKKNVKKKKIKKLKPGTTYYVKIRACTRKKACGPWHDWYRAQTTSPPPVIQNLLVDFEPWNPETGMAGAFDFDTAISEDKVFLEFGAVVEGPDGEKILPTFEYRVDPDATVYAPITGYVTSVTYQESTTDYEIALGTTKDQSATQVGIDHITNLTVQEGDRVTAGDVLGNPGTWSGSMGRVEIDIYGADGHYCPFTFFDPDLLATYEAAVNQHMADWESFTGDADRYDQASMTFAAGCLYETLTEDEL